MLGFSALRTGVGYLAVALTAVVMSGVSQALVTRFGVKPVLASGLTLLGLGLVYFTQISVDGSYLVDLLPGFLLVGIGMGFSFVPISIAALAGVESREAGLASGLINTSQQIGGALGVAVMTTIYTNKSDSAVKDGVAPLQALVDGFSLAFWAGAAFMLVSVIATLVVLRRRELESAAPEGVPVA